jgi:hypothetical protein
MTNTITPRQRRQIDALSRVSLGLGRHRTTAFIRSMERLPPNGQITPRQALLIDRLAWQYRKQMPAGLVPMNEPPPFDPYERPGRQGARAGAAVTPHPAAPAPLPLFEWAS